jgi:predicted SAM-dependent methyltransferase
MNYSNKPLRLHLGSGGIRIPGYLNIDLVSGKNVDIVDDVGLLSQFESGTVDSIYACHVLEHFSHEQGTVTISCVQVLNRWFELLKPGGELFVAVPNSKEIFRAILKKPTRCDSSKFFMAIYGGQEYPTNVHYSGYTYESLKEILKKVGFKNVSFFKPFVNDTTKFCIQGVKVSLNLKAIKEVNSIYKTNSRWTRIFNLFKEINFKK